MAPRTLQTRILALFLLLMMVLQVGGFVLVETVGVGAARKSIGEDLSAASASSPITAWSARLCSVTPMWPCMPPSAITPPLRYGTRVTMITVTSGYRSWGLAQGGGQNELTLVYQPKISLGNGRELSAEALVLP